MQLGDLVWGETKSVPCITFRIYRLDGSKTRKKTEN